MRIQRLSQGKVSAYSLGAPLLCVAIVAVGLWARLLMMTVQTPLPNQDTASYEIVAEIMRRGGNVYAETRFYNYAPVWMHILAGLDTLGAPFGRSVADMARLFISLVDLVNAGLVAAILRRPLAVALIALNPLSIAHSGLHGQFEPLAVLPQLAAILLWQRRGKRAITWIWTLATASLLVKHLVVFLVWALLVYTTGTARRAALLMAAALGVLALSFVPYLPEGWDGIRENVLLYRGRSGMGSLSAFLPAPVALLVMVGTMGLLPLATARARLSLSHTMALAATVFLLTLPAFGPQYYLLVGELGALAPSPAYALLCLVGFLHWVWTYGLGEAFGLVGTPAWVAEGLWYFLWPALAWLVLEQRFGSRAAAALRR